jgi:hypothetical protein
MKALRPFLAGLAVLALALVATTPARAQSGPLDGVWDTTSTADTVSAQQGALNYQEKVMIEGTKATSEVLSMYGFTSGSTTVLSSSPVLKFTTTYTADRFGTLTITGTQTSTNVVTGTATWNRVDGSVWVYSLTMNRITTSTAPLAP